MFENILTKESVTFKDFINDKIKVTKKGKIKITKIGYFFDTKIIVWYTLKNKKGVFKWKKIIKIWRDN